MCRLLAYIGPRVSVQQLLYGQPYSLLRQSYAPRKQRHGRVNADGWGVGWYDFRIRPEPARYRTAQPMWADARFPEIAPLLTSELILAAVRDATPGAPVEESGAPPFLSGRFLFAHNGVIDGFRDGLGIELRRSLPTEREGQIIGTSDSEVVFALLLDRIDKGREPIEALVDVIHELDQLTTGRFNFVLTDGHEVLATTAGDSLYVLDGHSVTTTGGEGSSSHEITNGTYIASEPLDDNEYWREIPDRSLVQVTRTGTSIVSM